MQDYIIRPGYGNNGPRLVNTFVSLKLSFFWIFDRYRHQALLPLHMKLLKLPKLLPYASERSSGCEDPRDGALDEF